MKGAYITLTAAAARLGVCRDTVRAAVRGGVLKGVRSKLHPARFVGVYVESIERVEREHARLSGGAL